MVGDYVRDMRKEFRGYDGAAFQSDALAGVTVAAVALPLALAFGVGSGADAASGLITAIVSAFIIGAPFGAVAVVLGLIAIVKSIGAHKRVSAAGREPRTGGAFRAMAGLRAPSAMSRPAALTVSRRKISGTSWAVSTR